MKTAAIEAEWTVKDAFMPLPKVISNFIRWSTSWYFRLCNLLLSSWYNRLISGIARWSWTLASNWLLMRGNRPNLTIIVDTVKVAHHGSPVTECNSPIPDCTTWETAVATSTKYVLFILWFRRVGRRPLVIIRRRERDIIAMVQHSSSSGPWSETDSPPAHSYSERIRLYRCPIQFDEE